MAGWLATEGYTDRRILGDRFPNFFRCKPLKSPKMAKEKFGKAWSSPCGGLDNKGLSWTKIWRLRQSKDFPNFSAKASRTLSDLAAMAQESIGENAGDHRFADRDGPDADAGIMTAFGHDLRLRAGAFDRLARGQDRRGRLDGETRHDRLTRRDAAQYAAGIVR